MLMRRKEVWLLLCISKNKGGEVIIMSDGGVAYVHLRK